MDTQMVARKAALMGFWRAVSKADLKADLMAVMTVLQLAEWKDL